MLYSNVGGGYIYPTLFSHSFLVLLTSQIQCVIFPARAGLSCGVSFESYSNERKEKMLHKIGHTHYYDGCDEGDFEPIKQMNYIKYQVRNTNSNCGYDRLYIYCATLTEALSVVNEMNKAEEDKYILLDN